MSDIEPIRTVSVDYVRAEDGDDRYEMTIAPTSSIASSNLASGEHCIVAARSCVLLADGDIPSSLTSPPAGVEPA